MDLWKIFFYAFLINVYNSGIFGENLDDTVTNVTSAEDDGLQFTILDDEIHYTSNYTFTAIICLASSQVQQLPSDSSNFINSCQNSSSNTSECLTYADNDVASRIRQGISEFGNEVKAIAFDKINLMLGSSLGKHGVTFKDFQVNGESSFTINQTRSDFDHSVQFQLTYSIPKLSSTVISKVLVLLSAIGGGKYWSEFEDVEVNVFINATEIKRDSHIFLHLEDLQVDLSFTDIQMGNKNNNDNKNILESAMDVFINAYAPELLKEMLPYIKRKLASIMKSSIENWFKIVPINSPYLFCNSTKPQYN